MNKDGIYFVTVTIVYWVDVFPQLVLIKLATVFADAASPVL